MREAAPLTVVSLALRFLAEAAGKQLVVTQAVWW